MLVAGWISSKLTRGAWDYIPRKRHDKERRIPVLLIGGGALIKSSALLVGLIVFMVWSTSQDFVPGFSAYPLGMGAAIVVIMLGELVAKLLRRRTLDLVPEALSIVVVVVAVWMGFALLPPAGRELAPVDLLPGVAILVGVWLTWLLFTQIEARHNHG